MSTPLLSLSSRRDLTRARDIRAGVRIEIVTVVWMTVEAMVAITAGVVARSVLLTAFGVDSVIELVSGGTLLWRLLVQANGGTLERVEAAERRASWITGIGLSLLCLYVVASAAASLLTHSEPDRSLVGIALAVTAVVIMPVLVWRKRAIAERINSAALRADAACSLTCAYMAATLLVGLALAALFGWWWLDAVAAVALLYWLLPEAREAVEAARRGEAGCGCGDDACTS